MQNQPQLLSIIYYLLSLIYVLQRGVLQMNVAVISNGGMQDYKRIKGIIDKEYDFIVCADGGARHAYEMEIMPNLIVGDFDSLSPEIANYYFEHGIETHAFSSKKDKTDTHIAVEVAIGKKACKIGLFGCTGSRLDHTLANIQLLYYIRQNHLKGVVIDDYNEIFLSEESNVIRGEAGDMISLLSLSPITKGITLKGFLYPLINKTLYREDTIGISNELVEKEGCIFKTEGDLLIIKSKD